MIPRTISASSLQVAELCLDRWKSEYLDRASQGSNVAADTGTTVHGGLEYFVKAVYIDKTHAGLDKKEQKELLLTFYMMSYTETFNTTDFDTLHFTDGRDLIMKWFTRTDLSDREVLSVEQKETIMVPFNHPEGQSHKCDNCTNLQPGQCQVPFNYIIDRLDKTGEDEYEVVDYKSIRLPMQPDDLETKIQARAYALAVQIKFPNAKKIKVTFDLLRHDPISLWFTRDDNIRFWRFLVSTLQRIVDTPESAVTPSMNTECSWCVKKFTCPLIAKNISAGGIHALDISDKVALANNLKNMTKAHKIILEQLDEEIMRYAADNDELTWETENGYEVEIGSQRRRQFPADQAAKIMGPELFSQMGSMTLGNLEKIIKDESLDAEMRQELKSLIGYTTGNLSVKIKPKKTVF